MNRIDRLFGLLLQLQRRNRVRAEDLAAQFGISKRTVYRDIAALHEMGVPIVSLPGEGYELTPGFYLPPLLFTAEEAEAVFLGTQMLRQQAQGHLTDSAESALAKIAHVLPPATRSHVERLTAVIQFYAQTRPFDLDDAQVLALISAVQEQRVVWMRYFGFNRADWTERQVEPHALTYSQGAWYVSGYCRLRAGMRSFRLDRIDALSVLDERFEARDDDRASAEAIEVQIRFDPAVRRWVEERQHYSIVSISAEMPSAPFVCTYRVAALREILPWLLSWGAQAEPLAPDDLRQQVAHHAKSLLEKLT